MNTRRSFLSMCVSAIGLLPFVKSGCQDEPDEGSLAKWIGDGPNIPSNYDDKPKIRYWTGNAGDGRFDNPMNWDGNTAPQDGDNVSICHGYIESGFSDIHLNSITIDGDAIVEIGENVTLPFPF